MVNSSTALLGNSFSICPVIKSKPGALWLAQFLTSSLTSDGEKRLIVRVIGHARPKDVLMVFSKLLLLFVFLRIGKYFGEVISEGCSFFLVCFPQLPSSCRSGET